MSYANFKQELWSAHVQTETEKNCVLAAGCDYEFEGEVKQGNKVRILGVQRPTINNYTGAAVTAETVADTSITLDINIAKDFFFKIDDVDKAQTKPGLMEALTKEANLGLAEARDSAIAALAVGAKYASSATSGVDTEAEAMALIDTAFETLYGYGVKLGDDMELIVPPFMLTCIRNQIITKLTDNVKVVRKGQVGSLYNANVLMTNNLYVDASGYTYAMLRTKKAIAFCGQIETVEPTRLTATGVAADALFGLDVYGTKIVRQDELYIIKAKKA